MTLKTVINRKKIRLYPIVYNNNIMYFCIYVCIYMSTYIAVLSNAGKHRKIVRPSALDLDVVGDIPKRYRGGETASDRARRKRERHKRERQVQKTREYMELPNKVLGNDSKQKYMRVVLQLCESAPDDAQSNGILTAEVVRKVCETRPGSLDSTAGRH